MQTPQDVARKNLPDGIIASLRHDILRGLFKPGERLPPERELSSSLGTNRNTLREALRSLEAQGLVRARQGDGVRVLDFWQHGELSLLPHYFVTASTDERLEILGHMLRFRAMFCLDVITWAAEYATDASIDDLEHIVAQMEAAQVADDGATLAALELSLVRQLIVASGSVAILWLYNTVEKVVDAFLELYPDIWALPDSVVDSWRTVIDALRRRDAPGAEKALRSLMEQADAMIFRGFGLGAEQTP